MRDSPRRSFALSGARTALHRKDRLTMYASACAWNLKSSRRSAGTCRWIILFSVFSGISQAVHALTIDEVMIDAVKTNPIFKAFREATQASHEEVSAALSRWLPNIQLRLQAGAYRSYDERLFDTTTNMIAGTSSINLRQNLYRGGRDIASLRQAEERVRQSGASLRDIEQTILLRAATVFLDVVRAENTVALREASLASFQARLRATEVQFQIGDRTRSDVAQARSELNLATAAVAVARADLQAAQASYKNVVGGPPGDLEPASEPSGLPKSLEEARRAAKETSPTVRAARHAMLAAKHAVEQAARETEPTLDIVGDLSGTRRWGDLDHRTADSYLGLEFSVPLYTGGLLDTRLRQARHLFAQMQEEWHAALRDAETRVTTAWYDLHAARERAKALRSAVLSLIHI